MSASKPVLHAVPPPPLEVTGESLHRPEHPASASALAFGLAVGGAFTVPFILSICILAIGRGGSPSIWSSVIAGTLAVWLAGTVFSIWAAGSRGEWV